MRASVPEYALLLLLELQVDIELRTAIEGTYCLRGTLCPIRLRPHLIVHIRGEFHERVAALLVRDQRLDRECSQILHVHDRVFHRSVIAVQHFALYAPYRRFLILLALRDNRCCHKSQSRCGEDHRRQPSLHNPGSPNINDAPLLLLDSTMLTLTLTLELSPR